MSTPSTTAAPDPTRQHHLRVQVRAADLDHDDDARTITGIAVPWDTTVELWPGVFERFARGSVEPRSSVKLFWRHREVIGVVTDWIDTDAGWLITAKISATATGDEAYTLARDGAVDQLSIGFEPVEWEFDAEAGVTTHTRARVHEVSLVPVPAYEDARILQVRHANNNPNPAETEHPSMSTTTTAPEQQQRAQTTDAPGITEAEVRSLLTETERRLTVQLAEASAAGAGPVIETRSAGQLLKDAAAGDESALEALNAGQRAAFDTRQVVAGPVATVLGHDGTRLEQRDGGTAPVTTAAGGDTLKAAWVGDMTRIVDEAAGVRGLFSEGVLPSTGKFIEYGVLATNTHTVAEQENEGDNLTYGEVTLDTETAPVLTFGGYTQLTRQAIERSTAPLLDHNLRAQAIAAGKYLNSAFRAAYDAAVAAQTAAENTVPVPATDAEYADWLDAIVDAAVKFEDMALSLDGLIVDTATFKAFNRFTGSDGRPLFTYSGTGANVIGSLNVTTLRGDIANLPVYLNAKQTTPGQAFFNRQAIRTYRSPLVRLQDDNVVDLTRDFSVYGYVAFAPEIPGAIVPVERTTA